MSTRKVLDGLENARRRTGKNVPETSGGDDKLACLFLALLNHRGQIVESKRRTAAHPASPPHMNPSTFDNGAFAIVLA